MTCKDRLPELRRRARDAGVSSEPGPSTEECLSHSEADPFIDDRHHRQIQEIVEEVQRIRYWIDEVVFNTRLVRSLHSDPTYHTNKVLQERVDALATSSNAVGLKVCGALRQLEERASASSAGLEGRVARLQCAATRRIYATALRDHYAALQSLRDTQLSLLRDQIKLTNVDITDEECERLLDSDNVSFFVDNLETERAAAQGALRDAEVRRDELVRVEATLTEVRDLFVQLAHLIAAQQDQVDSVEYYALQATERVEYGGRDLLKGTVSRRKARKKKIGLIICLTSGFFVVLLVLVYT
ncbi:unnamed protein product [Leptosia nina]|uniref:t-SNARE coiled-coil homology domain-containing protein n=1 Tax=Leptosia nina TaxID=320188 RepID=A0AAV1IUG6_9NEOP